LSSRFFISGKAELCLRRYCISLPSAYFCVVSMTTASSNAEHELHLGKQPPARKSQIHIVVADDHPVVRAGIIANLKQHRDMKVVAEGSDGVEALELIKRHLPDVVLLDLRMPRMDGLDVIAEVNALHLKTKVIVMTTFESQEDIQRSVNGGARGYLLKDCSQQIWLEAIRRVYLGEAYLLPQIAQKLVDRMQKPQLSPRELEVLKSVSVGKSNKEIGVQLFISEGTVKTHVASLLVKLGAACRTSAVREGVRLGLVRMD
jgi:two-component system, NarL family, response regulator